MPHASYFKNQVRKDVGDVGRNAIFALVFPVEATAGTWTFAFAGQSSADISRNALPGAVRSALEAIPSIGSGNIEVELRTFPNGKSGYALEFMEGLGAQPIPTPTADGADLEDADGDTLNDTGSIAVQMEEPGKRAYFSVTRLDEMWERRDAYASNIELRYLWMRHDALWELRGLGWPQVNTRDGDREREYSDQIGALERMFNDTLRAVGEAESGAQAENFASQGQTIYGDLTTKTPSGRPYRFSNSPARRGY